MGISLDGRIVLNMIGLVLTRFRIGSFYAFILERTSRVRLTVVARSNYEAVKNHVCFSSLESKMTTLLTLPAR